MTPPSPTVAALLAAAQAQGVPRLDAHWLLAHALGRTRSWLLAHDDEAVPPDAAAWCQAAMQRRAAGEPLAYVLGRWEFCGLSLRVSPAVLVPRPETELLVDWALECLATAPSQRVLDLGTGSGAIALALASRRAGLQLAASDASAEALAVASANAAHLGVDLALFSGDWWAAVPGGSRWGLVVSNPPYVAADDTHLAALQHEPRVALTPGGDGLDALRRIVAGAPRHLQPGAWLLLEHGHDQARAVQALLARHGFVQVQTRQDLAGMDRCTGGCLAS